MVELDSEITKDRKGIVKPPRLINRRSGKYIRLINTFRPYQNPLLCPTLSYRSNMLVPVRALESVAVDVQASSVGFGKHQESAQQRMSVLRVPLLRDH